jgi:SPP1 gp7 family putative phage head morphogenesis protein
MQFSLATMAARKRKSRRPITFAPILTTKAQADSLASIYLMMIEAWGRAHEILGDAYRREMARLTDANSVPGNITRNIQDSAEDLGATNDAIAQAINRLILELTPQLRRWAVRTEEWHRGKWVRAVLAGAQVDLDLIIGAADVRETVDAWLVRQTSLIRDVNEQARGKVADAVLRGYQQRLPVSEVMKDVREATGFARARARRIAADQTSKLSAALDNERQRQAGINVVKYHHSGKRHPREEHKARDGQLYELDTWREVRFVGGKKVYGADTIEADDRPGIPPFCACTTSAVLVFEGEVL